MWPDGYLHDLSCLGLQLIERRSHATCKHRQGEVLHEPAGWTPILPALTGCSHARVSDLSLISPALVPMPGTR